MAMNFSEDYIGKIRRLFGLNLYEAKVWLALLSQGKATTGRLSDIANIPKSRSYDILVSLENGGFIVRNLSKPISYSAIPPSELLDRLEEKAKEAIEARLDKLNKLRDSVVIKDLQSLYEKGIKFTSEEKVATSYQGSDAAYFRIKKSIKGAKEEVILVSTGTALGRKIKALGRTLKQAKESGVNVKVFAPASQLSEDVVSELKDIGKVNKLNMELGRFILVDGDEAFVFTENDVETHPSSEVVLHLRSKYLTDKLKKLAAAHSA